MKNFIRSTRLVCVVLLAVFAFSCTKSTEQEIIDIPIIEAPQNSKLSTIILEEGNNVYGHIVDTAYNPIPNVAVSDGYSVVLTNTKGEFQFKKHANAGFVFYSTPSNYAVSTATGRNVAYFYAQLNGKDDTERHTFVLQPLAIDENKFTLYAIGDPQVANVNEVNRFIDETMKDIIEQLAKSNTPSYGISLGDVVADQPSLFNMMKSAMGSSRLPVFTTVGNHDKSGGSVSIPRNTNSFESHYGPLNYSFNRGDVHFVCMDNVVFKDNSNYSLGFSQEQIDWLEKDLALVPKDKMLILYYHMPIRGTNFSTRSRLFELVKGFKEVHFMAGHTHYNENYIHTIDGKEIFEHVHAASCGAWWKSTINGDGTPNGYALYEIEGTTIKNWIYKPTNLSSDFQIRLHLGNASYGGDYGNFSYGKPASTLIANVWNADPAWKIAVYLDNQYSGDMKLNTSLNNDAWSLGYHIGVLNRNPANYTTATKHLYTFDLPANYTGAIKVVATDRFGRNFEQSQITTDLSAAISY